MAMPARIICTRLETCGDVTGTRCHCQHVVPHVCARRAIIPAVEPNGLSLQERKQELVRAELFNAAWQLFGERGYEATTVAADRRRRRRVAAHVLPLLRVEGRRARRDERRSRRGDARGDGRTAARRAAAASPSSARWCPCSRAGSRAPIGCGTIIRLLRESRTLRRAMLERHALMEERLAVQLAVRLDTDVARDSTPALLAFVARAMMDTAFNIAYDHGRSDVAALVAELFTKLGEHTALRAGSS